eukprot:SAG22_NODE_8107_length_682_cov_0.931389_1_plen_20_part_10
MSCRVSEFTIKLDDNVIVIV